MTEENEKDNLLFSDNDDGANNADSVFVALLKLSVKTLFYIVLAFSIGFASFMQTFPLAAARFYYDLQDYNTAVVYAKKSVIRSNNLDATIMGIEISEKLLFDAKTKKLQNKSAEDLMFFTDSIVFNKGFNAKTKAYDDFYKNNASSIIARIGLYSYKDYIYSLNTAARSVLGKADKLLFNPLTVSAGIYPTAEKGYILVEELEDYFAKIIDGDINTLPQTIAIILNQLNQNIIWANASLLYNNSLNTTSKLYDLLIQFVAKVPSETDFSYALESFEETNPLKQLYLLDAAVTFYENMNTFFKNKNNTYEKDKLNDYFTLKIIEEEILLSDFYEIIINHYLHNGTLPY